MVLAEDEPVAEYACDGVIFSTPTGSTAYNLAAGGPLVHPSANVLVMSRSVVFPRESRLIVKSAGEQDPPTVATDGREAFAGPESLPLQVAVPEETFPLLEEESHSHFRVLRNKLKWD